MLIKLQLIDFLLEGKTIESVDDTKYLVSIIDKKLSLEQHSQTSNKKTSNKLMVT